MINNIFNRRKISILAARIIDTIVHAIIIYSILCLASLLDTDVTIEKDKKTTIAKTPSPEDITVSWAYQLPAYRS